MSVHIDERVCKGCGLCVYYCKSGVLAMSERRNQKGFTVVEVSKPKECKTCRLCEINCPDLSIYVVKDRKSSGGKGSEDENPKEV